VKHASRHTQATRAKYLAAAAIIASAMPSRRAALLAGSILAASSSGAFAASCEALATAQIPSVTINSATSIPAGTYTPPGGKTSFPNLPAFCRVTATISSVPDSSIAIEVWLPSRIWNGRYLQVGNHGYGSGIYESEMAPQLQRGFATGATDDGHSSTPATTYDLTWAYGHPEKIIDFAYRAVHELSQTAKQIIADFYTQRLYAAYFNGCSDGGREGLREAHDFPEDFNGILIGGVASYWTHSATQLFSYGVNLENAGIQGTTGNAILTLAQNAVTAACDGKDGVVDGLINNPSACHWDPHSLVCQPGENPSTCITSAQADALQANIDPVRDPLTGKWIFSGVGRGSEFVQIAAGRDDGINAFALVTYQLAFNNPSYNGSTFNLHKDYPLVDDALGVINLTDPDLRPFAAGGGKLIQWHGWDDNSFTPGWETRYYNDVVEKTGGGDYKRAQQFFRLFMLPGVGHCAPDYDIGPDDIGAENQTAVSPDPKHDAVSALLDWTEHGTAPDELIATKFNNNVAADGIQLQRPIYPYPVQTIYNGSGSTSDAANFHPSREPRGPNQDVELGR
jgi:feruloyl esterase